LLITTSRLLEPHDALLKSMDIVHSPTEARFKFAEMSSLTIEAMVNLVRDPDKLAVNPLKEAFKQPFVRLRRCSMSRGISTIMWSA
jgi:hypothetical protein